MRPSVFWTFPRYVFTLGLWALWRSRHQFVLTNQRVGRLQGIITKDEKTVPIGRIQDVNLKRSILTGGWVTLSSAGGALSIETIGPLTRDGARQFADTLSAQQNRHAGDGLSAAPGTGPGALRPMPLARSLSGYRTPRDRPTCAIGTGNGGQTTWRPARLSSRCYERIWVTKACRAAGMEGGSALALSMGINSLSCHWTRTAWQAGTGPRYAVLTCRVQKLPYGT